VEIAEPQAQVQAEEPGPAAAAAEDSGEE